MPYTAFTSKPTHTVTARLIVRRVRRLAPPRQGELLPAWRHHTILTDSPLPMPAAETDHHDHTIIEQVIAELINGPPAHLPSGDFAANAAWLTCAGNGPQPATRRRHPRLPAPRHHPRRHRAPRADQPPSPAGAPRTRPRDPAPAPGPAPARRVRGRLRRHPPRTTHPRGLTGTEPTHTTRRPPRPDPHRPDHHAPDKPHEAPRCPRTTIQ